jgi:hypothetical protein
MGQSMSGVLRVRPPKVARELPAGTLAEPIGVVGEQVGQPVP